MGTDVEGVRSAALLVALALTVPLAGCATVADGLSRMGVGGGGPDVRLQYYRLYEEQVLPQHERVYDVPVQEGARRVVATLVLELHDAGTGAAQRAPARLDAALVAPDGAVLETISVSPAATNATLQREAPLAAGTYQLRVSGSGVSQTLDGVRYGAGYSLGVEVAYE